MITNICQKTGITNSLLSVKYTVNKYDWVFNLNSYKLRENGTWTRNVIYEWSLYTFRWNQCNYFRENHFLLALQIRYKIQNIFFFYKFSPYYSTKIPFCHKSLLISILWCAEEKFYAADATIWLSFFLLSLATVSMETILLVSFSAAAKYFVGAEGINWSTASKMFAAGPYSMKSSESRSSTTDSNTRERTGNTHMNNTSIRLNTATELWIETCWHMVYKLLSFPRN